MASIVGVMTGVMWLATGGPDWSPMDLTTAFVFVLFGGLLMLSWSRVCREVSWIMLVVIGLSELLGGGIERSMPGALAESWWPGVPVSVLSGMLMFFTGVRIFAATRVHYVAPVLDGVIIGISAASLVGYSTGITELHEWGVLGSISFLEALGYLALGVLFLLADIEYARLSMRARQLPLALGLASLVATISFRITEVSLDAAGFGSFGHLLTGQAQASGPAIGATNLVLSLSIGVAVLLLMTNYDGPNRFKRLRASCKRAEAEHSRLSEYLNTVLGDIDTRSAQSQTRLERAAAALDRCAASVDAMASEGPVGSGGAERISKEIKALRDEIAGLAKVNHDDAVLRTFECDPERLDLLQMVQEVACRSENVLKANNIRLSVYRAQGDVYADHGLLDSALEVLLRRAAENSAGAVPFVAVALSRQGRRDVISVTFSAGSGVAGETGGPGSSHGVDDDLHLAKAVAGWHSGDFTVAFSGSARIYNISIPALAGTSNAGGRRHWFRPNEKTALAG